MYIQLELFDLTRKDRTSEEFQRWQDSIIRWKLTNKTFLSTLRVKIDI